MIDRLTPVVRGIDLLSTWAGRVAAVLVIPTTLVACWEVFARYVFNEPTIWAYELGYQLAGSYFLLGGALTLVHQRHIRIDLIYDRLSPKRRAIIDLACFGVMLPLMMILVYRMGLYAHGAWASGELSGESAWNPVIWPFRTVWVVAFALLCLQVVAELIRAAGVLVDREIARPVPADQESAS